MYKNKYDKRNAAEIGNKAERIFVALAVQNGFKIKSSTVDQNKKNRIDYFLKKENSVKGVDVKARKKICAYDKSYSDTWTWVEFKTADGFHGWLYGDCDYIAFEKKDYFLIVDRVSLKNLCEKAIDRKKEFVKTCSEAKYRIYQRRDREEIALIKTSDIKKLKRKTIWKKNQNSV
jgi:hypothetical protein